MWPRLFLEEPLYFAEGDVWLFVGVGETRLEQASGRAKKGAVLALLDAETGGQKVYLPFASPFPHLQDGYHQNDTLVLFDRNDDLGGESVALPSRSLQFPLELPTPPMALMDLAEGICGFRLNDRGMLERIPDAAAMVRKALEELKAPAKGGGPWMDLADCFRSEGERQVGEGTDQTVVSAVLPRPSAMVTRWSQTQQMGDKPWNYLVANGAPPEVDWKWTAYRAPRARTFKEGYYAMNATTGRLARVEKEQASVDVYGKLQTGDWTVFVTKLGWDKRRQGESWNYLVSGEDAGGFVVYPEPWKERYPDGYTIYDASTGKATRQVPGPAEADVTTEIWFFEELRWIARPLPQAVIPVPQE